MAKNISIQKIAKEDFKPSEQEMVDKLAYPLNLFMLQVSDAFNKNIDFSNLSLYTKELDIEANYNGNVTATFKAEKNRRTYGIICLRAQNLTNTSIGVTSQPFINYTENNGNIVLSNITGLVASGMITNITTGGVVTISDHNLTNNQYLRLSGTGVANLDNKTFKITVIDENTININFTPSAPATTGFYKTDRNRYKLNLLVIPS